MKNMSTFNKLKKNEEKEQESLTKQRDDFAKKVAEDIMSILKESNLMIGEENHEKLVENYTPIYQKIVNVLLLRRVKIKDIGYIISFLYQPLDFVKDLVLNSLNNNLDLTNAKLFGLNDMKDLTINDLDEKMKTLK